MLLSLPFSNRLFTIRKTMFFSLVFIGLFFSFSLAQPIRPKILVFTKTQGFDHATRAIADSLIKALGAKNGFDVDTTNTNVGFFTDTKLNEYKAVCFINTTGALLTDPEKASFQRFIEAGGGFVGMHASADCEYTWHWYHELLGAYFVGHPFNIAKADLAILDHNNPSTQFIKKDTISMTDEWYFFENNTYDSLIDPAKLRNLSVLINLVESSLPNSTRNKFHPMCWYQLFDGGRAWYSGFGHQTSYFRDTLVQKNLLGGILWAAGITSSPILLEKKKPLPLVHAVPREVFDMSGKKIRKLGPASNSKAVWDKKDDFGRPVAQGVYFVKMENGASRVIKPISVAK
jgi:cytochrome c